MKIACFHLNQIGDLIFSLPALKSIRDSYPNAEITSIVRPGLAEILECAGLVDEILVRRGGINFDKLRLIKTLAERRFDLAIVFSQSAETAMLSFACKAPRRVGFINSSMGVFLTKEVGFSHPPSTQNNLRLISEAGCRITCNSYTNMLTPSAEMMGRAQHLLKWHGIDPSQSIIALSPGTSGRRSVKEWTDEGFAAVASHFSELDYRIVVIGTQPADGIVNMCPYVIDLSGKTDLGEALAILHKAAAVVAVDSGALHMAAAAGTQVIGLYGSSDPKITGPQGEGHVIMMKGEECSPCIRTECNFKRKCMTNIHPDKVIEAMESILTQPEIMVKNLRVSQS